MPKLLQPGLVHLRCYNRRGGTWLHRSVHSQGCRPRIGCGCSDPLALATSATGVVPHSRPQETWTWRFTLRLAAHKTKPENDRKYGKMEIRGASCSLHIAQDSLDPILQVYGLQLRSSWFPQPFRQPRGW